MLDTSFLLRDESHPELWHRDNKHLIYDGDTNLSVYQEAVLLHAAGRYLKEKHAKILEGKTRKEFNYELFLLRFLGWEDHIQPYYKPLASHQHIEMDKIDNNQPRSWKARKRQRIVHSSDDEVILKKAAVERLKKQNKEPTTSLAEDVTNQPQEMSKQVTMEPEATEL